MMAVENTFIMLKPDCLKRGLVGEIISRIEKKGYRIIAAKMMMLDAKFLYVHYAHMSDRPFFSDILKYMLSGPVLGLSISGENAVLGMRLLIGATDINEAKPGSIRGDFATSIMNNLIHGSESAESAKVELARFFL
jgi:nucleoside-diphosphate kinase